MTISEKARKIAPSATLAMDAKAKALMAEGVSVISFAAGEPDFNTPEPVKEAMREAMEKNLTRYAPTSGTKELKDAIIYRLKQDYKLKYTPEEIIVSSGAKHSLYNVFQTLLDPGDEVIIDNPCWVSYPEMVRMAGGTPVFLYCPETQGFLPDMEDLEKLVTPRTKAFVLNNPSNPNGCIWNRQQLEALAKMAVKHDFYIIADEIYDKLVYDGRKHVSIASLGSEIKKRTIIINGVSKSYAMTGFRIGYAAGPKDVIKAMTNYQSQATSNASTPAQHAAAVALTMPQDCVEEMRRSFQKRRDMMVSMLNSTPGLGCNMPHGAFYVMMNITELFGKYYGEKQINTSEDFALTLLENAHVATVPGSAFMAEGFCRLSYATSMENVIEGMTRIANFVKELK
ncbi:MAG: pyridoxal phosphate-dependent aminotransferase [Clostridiales bacterium]|nr:pyridoxal phosphate-dependent aminotransferase [Clostridiales bacterium]